MKPIVGVLAFYLVILCPGLSIAQTQASATPPGQEHRIAFVVGNGAYQQAPLPTAANDAGLVAQTLQAAGFDVVGARDLDGETLRRSFRDFIQKVQAAGPDTVAMVYLAGYGLQLSGDNYFVPVDARIERDIDVPVEALRVSDYTRQLAALPLKAGIVVLDAARPNGFAKQGQPLAGGLALVDPEPRMLIAFNAAPGTVAPERAPPYGAYAQALAEMIRTGGMQLPELFDRVRLRVNEMTKGAEIPWDAQRIEGNFMFFEREPSAPAPAESVQTSALRSRSIRDFSASEAYTAAIQRDTLADYEAFLAAYPSDPLAKRVEAMLAARREAVVWRRTVGIDTPPAYWSYLDRYPRGPHAYDARRRLAILAAALAPPPTFVHVVYDVPPPPPDEIVYVDRPVLYFGDPVFAFAPPPPPPVIFLLPPPPDFVVLAPPPPPIGIFVLPTPFFVPIPAYISPPRFVAPPPNNIIFANIHNTTVINNVINNPAPVANARPGEPSVGRPPVALPPVAAQKASMLGAGMSPRPGPAPVPPNGVAGAKGAAVQPSGLPGSNGQPLPKPNVASAPSAGALPAAKSASLPPPPAKAVAPKTAAPAASAAAPKAVATAPANRTAPAPSVAARKTEATIAARRQMPSPAVARPMPPPRVAAIRPPPLPRPQAVDRPPAPRPQPAARMQPIRPAAGPRPQCRGLACKR